MFIFLRKLITICALLALNSHAGELITNREFFVDGSSNKTLTEVSQEQLTQFTGVLSQGYTKAAIWIRLEITPPIDAGPDDEIIVRIRPVFLDEIRLYDPLDSTGSVRVVGDTTTIQSEEFPSLSHTFAIPAGSTTRAIWLRLKTTSTNLMNVEALTRKEMIANELNLNLIYFTAIAILAMFVLVIIINWINHREMLYGIFVLRQIYFLAYTASLFGLHRYLFKNFTPHTLDYLFSWIVIHVTAISFIFEWKFLSEYSIKKLGRFIINFLLACSGTVILLMIFGKTQEALKANMILNAMGIVILLIVSVLFIDPTKIDKNPDTPVLTKNLVVSYYAALNIVLFISVLPLLGIIKGSEYTFTGMVFYAFCSSLLMTALMQFRINKLRNIHSEYENRLLLSEHRIILEKNKREEQTHLFHMLMHEIKNPLAVIDMALLANNDQRTTSAYVSRAVNSVKDILDRCFKANRLSDGNIDVKLTKIFLADFFDQLFLSKNWQRNAFQLDVTELLIVTADLQLLGIVLSNLLDNALRYGDPQMPVDVAAKIKSNKSGIAGVSIVVSNRPGIASWPDPDKVFKKYYRSAGAEAQSGTGLGLYLIRTLANLMHGDCNYVPDDKNIRFELWLPT